MTCKTCLPEHDHADPAWRLLTDRQALTASTGPTFGPWSQNLTIRRPGANIAWSFWLRVVGAAATTNPVTLEVQCLYEIPGASGIVSGYSTSASTNDPDEIIGVWRDQVVAYRTENAGVHQWIWPRFESMKPSGEPAGMVIPAHTAALRWRLRDLLGTATAELTLRGYAP